MPIPVNFSKRTSNFYDFIFISENSSKRTKGWDILGRLKSVFVYPERNFQPFMCDRFPEPLPADTGKRLSCINIDDLQLYV